MSETTRTSEPAPEPEIVPTLQWRCWPLGDGMPYSWIGVSAIGVVFGVTLLVAESWLAACAAACLLIVAGWRFFIPVSYTVDAGGLSWSVMGRRRSIAWSSVRHCAIRFQGVMLYTRQRVAPLDALRAVYVPWCGNREALLDVLKRRLAADALGSDQSGGP